MVPDTKVSFSFPLWLRIWCLIMKSPFSYYMWGVVFYCVDFLIFFPEQAVMKCQQKTMHASYTCTDIFFIFLFIKP